jgi:hypothetical protein
MALSVEKLVKLGLDAFVRLCLEAFEDELKVRKFLLDATLNSYRFYYENL